MGKLSRKAATALKATGFPFWSFLFHVTALTGTCRHGGGRIRVLYAGTKPFFHYFKEATFSESPAEEFIGTFNIFQLGRVCEELACDIEVLRGHQTLAKLGLFPAAYFVPEWISGTSNLTRQLECEKTSKSRRRDRSLLERNQISYSVTRNLKDLRYFYDEMYLPHINTKHGESVYLMTRDQMNARVQDDDGVLVMIRHAGKPAGGSLIVHEKGLPRLYSQGVLGNDRELMRLGVGTAIYLYSFDYLLGAGYERVNMGWSRALLNDGSLYFKQRFGLVAGETSAIGHYIGHTSGSDVANNYLTRTGFLHRRRGNTGAVLFGASDSERDAGKNRQKRAQCESMGIIDVTTIDLQPARRTTPGENYHEETG